MSIRARHTISGKINEVEEDIFYHDILGKYLERVDEDAKPLVPELHRPREADVADKSNDTKKVEK